MRICVEKEEVDALEDEVARLTRALELFADQESWVYQNALDEPHEIAQKILSGEWDV